LLLPVRNAFLLLSLLGIAGCSVSSKGAGLVSDGFSEAPGLALDSEIERESSRLHSYLRGQIALNAEDREAATESLAETSRLTKENVPALHEQLAWLYLSQGKIAEALEESSRTIQVDGNPYHLSLHAGLLEAVGKYDEAAAVYQQIVHQEPSVSNPYILLASIHLKLKRFDRAVNTLSGLVAKKPDDLGGNYYLARTHELIGSLPLAERYMKIAYDLRPETDKLALDYVRILLRRDKVGMAQGVASKLAEHSSQNAIALSVAEALKGSQKDVAGTLELLGFLETFDMDPTDVRFKIAIAGIEANELEQAAINFLLVIARDPDNSKARYYLGSIYASRGQKKAAVDQLLAVKQGEEMFAEARTLASFVLKQVGDFKQAEKSLRAALRERPDDQTLLIHMVELLRDQKKFKEAFQIVTSAVEKNPASDRLLFMRGITLHDLQRDREAEEMMERVIEINAYHGQALNYVAYALAERKENLDRAKELIERALQVYPEDGYFLDTQGWLLFGQGEYGKAREILLRAMNLLGEDVVVREHYADCLEKLGEMEKAIESYGLALSVAQGSEDDEEKASVGRLKNKIAHIVERFPNLQSLVRN